MRTSEPIARLSYDKTAWIHDENKDSLCSPVPVHRRSALARRPCSAKPCPLGYTAHRTGPGQTWVGRISAPRRGRGDVIAIALPMASLELYHAPVVASAITVLSSRRYQCFRHVYACTPLQGVVGTIESYIVLRAQVEVEVKLAAALSSGEGQVSLIRAPHHGPHGPAP